MADSPKDFGDYLDRLARAGEVPDDETARQARRLLEAGRRAVASPAPGRKARTAALRTFRKQSKPVAGLLRLVFDSWAQASLAVRAGSQPTRRFLRFEGDVSVDVQVTPAERGVEVRGQLDPSDSATAILLRSEGRERSANVASDGTFVLRRVSSGTYTLVVGDLTLEGLDL
jgi:hypothetical protein